MNATVYFYREECDRPDHRNRGPRYTLGCQCDKNCEFVERTYEVMGTVAPIIPARASGPPEDCYPAEGGEIEIEAIIDAETGDEVDLDDFTEREIERMQELLSEQVEVDDGDWEPDDPDDGPPDSFDPPDTDY